MERKNSGTVDGGPLWPCQTGQQCVDGGCVDVDPDAGPATSIDHPDVELGGGLCSLRLGRAGRLSPFAALLLLSIVVALRRSGPAPH